MDFSGEYRIAAPRSRVWQALNDPEALKASIPGCQTIAKVTDTEFTATVQAKVGPLSAKFTGKVTLSDMDPPNGYTITGEGQGGVAGFGKGGAKVGLADDGMGGTVLSYTAHAQVGGKLAQIGSRLIDGAARKIADDFFASFAERLAAEAPPAPAPSTAPSAIQPPATPPSPQESGAPEPPAPLGLGQSIWPLVLVAAVLAVTLYLSRG
jgi:carbon monoxide dehydrogenase subunit G